ncbi:MAG: hypothetical protein ACM3US_08345 [Sphingomonadaceae bacterium]
MVKPSLETFPSDRAGAPVRFASGNGAVTTAKPPRTSAVDAGDGPDYVDDWMERNLDPGVMEFVRIHCTSFARWDLLRKLQSERFGSTVEALANATGTSPAVASRELQYLTGAGLVSQHRQQGRTVYRLRSDTPQRHALDAAIRSFDDNREFRFALVYAIVRASHRGAVME